MLSSALLLTHYNPSLPIVLAANASNYGVGAVISHIFPDGSEKAIAHASLTLSPAEKNHGQIEKESLAVIFAVKKFHKLLCSRHFSLLTDHKPLLSVFGSKTGIPVDSANRLQRWATILLGYDFSIDYCRTEDFGQVDGLSRLISNHQVPEYDTVIASLSFENDVRRQLKDAIRGIPVTADDIRNATAEDPAIVQVMEYGRTRWPNFTLSGEIHQLFLRRESLTVVDSSLIRPNESDCTRVCVLDGRGRPYLGVGQAFPKCQQAAKLPKKQDPVPWDLPKGPWSRIHLDFAGPINRVMYLVLVDAYSEWPEIVPLHSATSSTNIAAQRKIFSQHDFPEILVLDNGSQSSSAQFRDFCSRSNSQHVFSPPYRPQSNSQVERFVDTLKRALLKSRGKGMMDEILQTFLLV
ncbi:uncharacterized protein DEA37_0005729 [Paragonimus westermani]|uniref:Integrase catalytic domain-containing protein n=1 Tax=Paragonimus westermani TaxID=34504 RepID=A0A5J4NH32_9TREM|nr:uncharacterized protein DEA37_0005729 [Paragonimus westermani]